MRVACIHPKELDASLQQQWRTLQTATPRTASPYFHPKFALHVGALRADARVLVMEDGGRVVGFWGLHKRPDGFARPLGQPLADDNGPVLDPDAEIDLAAALRAAGIGAAAFTGAPSPPPSLARFALETDESAQVDLSAGGAATLAALKAAHGTHFKNMRRKERRAVESIGEITYTASVWDPMVLETLIGWKRAQFARTGLYDVLAPGWTRALLEALAQETDPSLQGMLTTLHLGDTLAAAELSLRSEGYLHSWITAYDPQFSVCSPGHLMQMRMIEGADAIGITLIDIGVGAGHYKRFYANAGTVLMRGVVSAASVSGAVHHWRSRLWRAAESAAPGDAFGRLRRRSEIIVSADQSLGGRVQGFVQAFRHAGSKAGAADAGG